MKRKLMALLSCVLVVGVLTSSVLAKDYTVGKSYAWSADSSSWYGYGNSPSIGQTVSTYSRLSWTTAAAAAINGELYTTIEHNVDAADNGVPLSAYRVFSDYPNPYYSYEDDGGDGYAEEAEVVFLDRVTPNIEYSVITDYKKETTRALSGTFNTILQRSFWLAGYQTMDYDLLETTSWQSPAARSSLSDEAVVDTETVTEPAPPRHVVRESEVTSDNLTAYFENQFSAFSEAFQMQPRTSENTRVTVTFAEPISMDELQSLISTADATLNSYHAKFTNSSDEWSVVSSRDIDEAEMIEWANECANSIGNPNKTYDGIVSMEVDISATESAIGQLSTSPLVYGVDLSNYLYAHSEEYDPSVKIVVPHYAWEVAHF